jgi:hypothetical protein
MGGIYNRECDLDNISAVSELINNTFSFLHLSIQSSVSKIDMISAEYSCHDILSCWVIRDPILSFILLLS